VVVKRSQVRSSMRRLLDQHKPSRSLRSWNGTSELLRRGIATPRPIAFFEDAARPQAGVGYYICETFPFRGSVRNAFYDFARGAADYEGVPKAVLYRELAAFVRHMHLRGVYFRDLSAGNILIGVKDDGMPCFSLIDTTRARFFQRRVSVKLQLSDLKRICHRLTWPERYAFLNEYFETIDSSLRRKIQVVFGLYDFKHWYKQRIKEPRKFLSQLARRR
jgi:hypothetical protein